MAKVVEDSSNQFISTEQSSDVPLFPKEGNEINLIDVIEDKTPDMIENIFLKDNIKSLEKYLKLLNTREREIIAKRYGLNGEDEKTQKQIAKDFHISRSYVSRIEKRALTKLLKEFIKEKKLLNVEK